VGLWIEANMRQRGARWSARVGLIVVFSAAPAVLQAVFYGHPEEPLGAALCIGAILCARDGRPRLAGGLLGAAVVNKPWGVLAAGPVLLCARRDWRRCAVPFLLVVGSWFAAFAA